MGNNSMPKTSSPIRQSASGVLEEHIVRFFTFEQFHAKRDVGSTRLRAHNLIKYWDGAGLYQYGEKPDVLIFQKVYTTFDYKFPLHFEGIKILDVCDPDWKDTPDIYIKETIDAMDAVVTPTTAMQEYLQQMTTTPVRVIKDRFDLSEFPKVKAHKGKIKNAVWFGYAHNAEAIKFAIPSLEKRGIGLIVISNEDPACYRWAASPTEFQLKYKYIKFQHPKAYIDTQLGDVCVMTAGFRPLDIFKSENKTIISKLLGVPVVNTADELDTLMAAEARNKTAKQEYDKLMHEYDCRKSVEEYKELIKEIRLKSSYAKR